MDYLKLYLDSVKSWEGRLKKPYTIPKLAYEGGVAPQIIYRYFDGTLTPMLENFVNIENGMRKFEARAGLRVKYLQLKDVEIGFNFMMNSWKKRIKDLGYTQKQFADYLHISTVYISQSDKKSIIGRMAIFITVESALRNLEGGC